MSKPLTPYTKNRSREDKQRRLVRARDGKLGCRFERRLMSGKWIPCGKKEAHDTAHILRRAQCGEVWDAPEVAMLACRTCHNNFDRNVLQGDAIYEVRVPYDLAKGAWDLVVSSTKVPPYAKYDPDQNPVYADVIIGRGLAS